MGSKSKTVTSLQIVPLLEPGAAIKKAKTLALRSSRGKAIPYFYQVYLFKRDYRKSYSKQFLDTLGLSPSTNITTKVPSNTSVKNYLEQTFSYTSVTVTDSVFTVMDLRNIIDYSFTHHPNYDPVKNRVVVNGVDYYVATQSMPDTTTINLTLRGASTNSIITRAVSNPLYGSNAVFVEYIANAQSYYNYEVQSSPSSNDIYDTNGVLDSTKLVTWLKSTYGYTSVTLNRYYEGILSDNDKMLSGRSGLAGINLLDNTIIENSITYIYDSFSIVSSTEVSLVFKNAITFLEFTYTVTNTLFDERVLLTTFTYSGISFPQYNILSAEDPIVNTLITNTNVSFTAILPLREDNIVNSSTNITRMLKKLNLPPKSLRSTLENPNLDNVYLTSIVSMNVNDNTHNQALFDIFSYLLFPQGIFIPVKLSQLYTDYRFKSTKTRINGVVNGGDLKAYSRVDTTTTVTTSNCPTYVDENGNTVPDGEWCWTFSVDTHHITIRHQIDANSYDEVVISGFEQGYIINGSFFPFNNLSADKVGMIIPLDVYSSWNFKTWMPIYENSLSLIAFSKTTTKVAWYQSGIFAIILKLLIVIVIIIVTVVAPPAGATIATLATNAAIGAAIAYGGQLIAKAIGGPLGAVVGALASIGAMYAFGIVPSFDISNASSWLPLVDKGIGVFNQVLAFEMDKMRVDYNQYMSNIDSKYNDIKDKLKEMGDPILGGFLLSSSADDIMGYAGNYVEGIVGSIGQNMSESNLYDIHTKIEARNNIINGVNL